MSTILFVDDQREILSALRRSLMQQLDDWEVHIATSGEEAIKMMEAFSFEIVVSDIKMPSMNGVEFLEHVANKHPKTLRFVLSGYTERDMVYKTISNVHQFLSKPLDTEQLVQTIQQAVILRDQLIPEQLFPMIHGLRYLPSSAAHYDELMEALSSASVSLNEVGELVQKNVALSARVMHLVNSSFFGTPVYVTGPSHAVSLLGTEIMKSLVLTSFVFSSFDENTSHHFNIHKFEEGLLQTASLAKRIAEEEVDKQIVIDDSFIAGHLHGIGSLILASRTPDLFDSLVERSRLEGKTLLEVEQDEFGVTHAEIGGALLSAWGFRLNVVEAVSYQYTPEKSNTSQFSALTAVHAANQLLKQSSTPNACPIDAGMNEHYLERIGVSHRLDLWKSISAPYTATLEHHD